MMRRCIALLLSGFFCAVVFSAAARDTVDPIHEAFQHPPQAASPWVFWYWMNGAVSREGITADLEAMKQAGLRGAYLMPLKDVTDPPMFKPPVRQLSPEYWSILRFAFSEADRLGLKFAMHDCDGFATAGGPWITPDLAMQRVVWSETAVTGGGIITTNLPLPLTKENFYRDIAVLAFPTPSGEGITTRTIIPKVTTSISGADTQGLADGSKRFRSENPCWIQYAFAQPFTCRSILVKPDGLNYQALRLSVEYSDDGTNFHSLGRFETPRHGWEDRDADYTFAIPPTTAKFFRFDWDPAGSEPGAEDLDSAKWKAILKIQGLELSSAPRIPDYEGKSGVVWRRSSRADAALIPVSACVPLDKIINLKKFIDVSGKLVWAAPPGAWTILRVGYTPTGRENETGGGGRGLECDKFNPAAAKVQFDGWFGETIKQMGPQLAGRVLTVFHVDSWEAGSQNWSPVFQREFRRRRGYDPTPYLPAFAGIPVGSAEISERFLYDVRLTIDELVNDNFFGTMAALAHKHGCEFSSESVAPTMMSDGMSHYSKPDVAMGEFWLHSSTHDKPNDMADAISGGHVYGKKIVQAEAFTELRLQWDETPASLKPLGDHSFCLGINRFVLHVFMENPWTNRVPGMTLGGVGNFFQRDQTWWPFASGWMDYLKRCQAMLQQGRPVADVLYFTGEELPSRAILPERYSPALPAGYAADSINRDALLRLASVKDGRIVLPGGASYAMLVLPDSPMMSPEIAAKIEKLVKKGATIYGPRPENSIGLYDYPSADETVWKTTSKVWGSGNAKDGRSHFFGHGRVFYGTPLELILQKRGVTPDFIVHRQDGGSAPEIEWTHRSTDEDEIYFIANQGDSDETLEVSLRAIHKRVELLNPVTGRMRAAGEAVEANGRTILPVRLAAHGSIFVVLREPAKGTLPVRPNNWIDPQPVDELTGDWQVTFESLATNQTVDFPQLSSWTENEEASIRFYSGTAKYAKTFEWNGPLTNRVWLDLGALSDIARVTVNGKDCGIVWTWPHRVDITEALRMGTNSLEIRVANTWNNRLVGDRGLPMAERKTWTNAADRPANAQVLPAGLLGPVTVVEGK